jgi:hypothetical protein
LFLQEVHPISSELNLIGCNALPVCSSMFLTLPSFDHHSTCIANLPCAGWHHLN